MSLLHLSDDVVLYVHKIHHVLRARDHRSQENETLERRSRALFPYRSREGAIAWPARPHARGTKSEGARRQRSGSGQAEDSQPPRPSTRTVSSLAHIDRPTAVRSRHEVSKGALSLPHARHSSSSWRAPNQLCIRLPSRFLLARVTLPMGLPMGAWRSWAGGPTARRRLWSPAKYP